MDPNACLIRLLESIDASDYQDARDALNELLNWIHLGGFKPDCGPAIAALREQRALAVKVLSLRKQFGLSYEAALAKAREQEKAK